MSKKANINTENLYLSERIESRLMQMKDYPLTVVEAPMGYGKTTCMRFFLKKREIPYVWISVSDSSQHYFWQQFCRAFSQIDGDVSCELKAVGFPEDDILANMAVRLISAVTAELPFIFVIDDYHLIRSPEMNRFFEFLARRNLSDIHFVLIGRNRFENCREELKLKNLLLTLTDADFRLTAEECGWYFESCGLRITQQQAENVCRNTEGWISALYLLLLGYSECGELEAENISSLFRSSLYEHYSEDQKDFLLRISIFREFTREQAIFVRRKANPSQILDGLVASNGFIRFDLKEKVYHIHNMYADFLQEKLEEQSREFIDEVYRHGADWYYLNREYYHATFFYYRSRDYNEMLKAFEKDKAGGLSARSRDVMIEAFEECPKAIRMRHPMANLLFAKQLSMMNEKERLRKTMGELRDYFETESLSESRKKELSGEYFMLLSFLFYNDLQRMVHWQQKAAGQLSRPSLLEGSGGSFTYGSPSVLHMFYRASDSADELVRRMHDSRELYYRLTDKNGYGADYILEAEIEFNRGNIDKAEILSYKAHHMAAERNQTGIIVCVLFLQARISLLRGETERGLSLLKELREEVIDSRRYLFVHTADMCRAFIYASFGQTDSVPEWIGEGEFDSVSIYHPALSFVYIIYGRVLLEKGQYARFLGEADELMKGAREFPNLLTEIYLHIYSAAALRKMNMPEEAAQAAEQAVRLTYQDKLYMPFVENAKEILPLLEESSSEEGRCFVEEVRKIYNENRRSLSAVLEDENRSSLSILTKREQEIAQLVSHGRTNVEIARELNIAEITVKKSLSNIYSRLGITNRAALARLISS